MDSTSNQQQAHSVSTSALHDKAQDNLRYIRDSMEKASSFTGVSGKGYIIAGVSSLLASWLAAQQADQVTWLAVWMGELLFAASIMFYLTAQKARYQGGSLWSTNGKKLLLAFFPAMAVGAILTLSFYLQGNISWLPGIWLCIYGAAVMTAGAYSVAIIPVMGFLFLILGSAVLLINVPTDLALGFGMGGFHIVFGYFIWRDHGG